jgi:hypothetical protein
MTGFLHEKEFSRRRSSRAAAVIVGFSTAVAARGKTCTAAFTSAVPT